MSGQFQNKQFGGDQFAGAEFGPDAGDSGIRYMSASLVGAGAIAAEATSVEERRRSGRIRKIVDGYVQLVGVTAPGMVGLLRAHGVQQRSVPAKVRLLGVQSTGGVGHIAAHGVRVSKEGKAMLPQVAAAGVVGVVLARAGAGVCVAPLPVSGGVGQPEARGAGCAPVAFNHPSPRLGSVRVGGVQNPTDEEMLAVVAMLRARRNARRLTPSFGKRRLAPLVTTHSANKGA